MGYRDPAVKTSGPEFDPQSLHRKTAHVLCVCTGQQQGRQEDSWGLMASQASLLSKLQAAERPCLKT